jgi:hypothetical protein
MWEGVGQWRAEASHIDIQRDGLSASGTQLGVDPLPYRLDYELEAGPQWTTRRLLVTAAGADWTRRLQLAADGQGHWIIEATHHGTVPLPPPGGEAAALEGALDCDLGRSPLTNTMPVRRHHLHEEEGAVDFLMAFVSVPDLQVIAARQRYEHLHVDQTSAKVRYVGEHRGFEGELLLDPQGLVLFYPDMAKQLSPATGTRDGSAPTANTPHSGD